MQERDRDRGREKEERISKGEGLGVAEREYGVRRRESSVRRCVRWWGS